MAHWTEVSWPERPDPFAAPPEAPTGLAAGWLVDPPGPDSMQPSGPAPAPAVPPTQPARIDAALAAPRPAPAIPVRPTPWRALGQGWRRFERRAAARLGVVPHPLAASRLLHGMTPAETRLLARRFHADTPVASWDSPRAALGHLNTLLPSWPVGDWSHVRGLQVFLGPAGSGKTTLLFRVARQLQRSGTQVTAVTLCRAAAPRAAFAALAGECGIAAHHAADAAALERLLTSPAGGGVLLVDTPCSASEAHGLQEFLAQPLLRHPRTLLHLCLSLQHGRASHENALRFAAAHRADCVAVAHVDLAASAGALLALLLAAPRRLSFASASADPAAPPLPFGAASLLEALGRGD